MDRNLATRIIHECLQGRLKAQVIDAIPKGLDPLIFVTQAVRVAAEGLFASSSKSLKHRIRARPSDVAAVLASVLLESPSRELQDDETDQLRAAERAAGLPQLPVDRVALQTAEWQWRDEVERRVVGLNAEEEKRLRAPTARGKPLIRHLTDQALAVLKGQAGNDQYRVVHPSSAAIFGRGVVGLLADEAAWAKLQTLGNTDPSAKLPAAGSL